MKKRYNRTGQGTSPCLRPSKKAPKGTTDVPQSGTNNVANSFVNLQNPFNQRTLYGDIPP